MRGFVATISGMDHREANSLVRHISGIVDCFASEEEKNSFVSSYDGSPSIVCEQQHTYGDWQTPLPLAYQVCRNHLSRFGQPDVVIEPTCGLGAFVLAALDIFTEARALYAIEINQEYVAALKASILSRAIASPHRDCMPDIYIYHADFFKFDFSSIQERCMTDDLKIAIVGNPPWVTNSRQGKDGALNLPVKSNESHMRGIDALTGKSNFDISEYITLALLSKLSRCRGGISILLKNSVIRSIVSKQLSNGYLLENIRQEKINASDEFDVSVDASCLSGSLGQGSSLQCDVVDFYTHLPISTYGWVGSRFSSDISQYGKYAQYDGVSTYVWRSGVKHDCAPVLELTYADGIFTNGLNEVVDIEREYIYPLLKSSDIQRDISEIKKFLVVTQRVTNQDTSYLKEYAPRLYAYLDRHEEYFARRKSSIYKGKDRFSIFGIGDYSFKPYKIVISSLYKTINFRLIKEYAGKPVLVDDTCYQLDFSNQEEAYAVSKALMSEEMIGLLRSLVFTDAKRVITKSLLMRLDLAGFCKAKGLMTETARPRPVWTGRQLSLFD